MGKRSKSTKASCSETMAGFDEGVNCPDVSAAGKLAEQLKALGHPARLQIILNLKDKENSCCGEVCVCMPLAQSTVSQHLDILKKAGLVDACTSGTKTIYSLNKPTFVSVSNSIKLIGS